MATRKPKPAEEGAQAEARALVDLLDHGVNAGDLLRADVATVAALAALGHVDMHPEAVAYAKAPRH